MRWLFFAGSIAIAACKAGPPPPAEAQLATDLPAGTVEQILRVEQTLGGPGAERVSASAGGDLHWDLEPGGAMLAAMRGELKPIPVAGADVPELWRDPGGTWVGIGGRAQVLLVSSGLLAEHPVPARFTALTEPWLKGKVAMRAPLEGAALAHFAALYEAWGEPRMRGFLEGLRVNEVQLFDSDEAVRLAVIERRAVVGLLGSDEAAKAAASAAKVEVVYPNQRSIGTFVWPTALYLTKTAAHPEAAARLAEKLADKSIEQLLVAREPGFLPLRPNIPTPPGVRSAANLVVISVDPARIAAAIEQRRGELTDWVSAIRGSPTPPNR